MPPIRHDLSKVSSFTTQPEGDYPGYLYKLEPATSNGPKTKGTPMLKVQVKLADGMGSVFDNVLLSDEFLWKWKQLCLAAGIEEDRLGADSEVDTEELQGQAVVVSLGIQPANGTYAEKNVIRKYHNPDTYQPTAATAVPAGW